MQNQAPRIYCSRVGLRQTSREAVVFALALAASANADRGTMLISEAGRLLVAKPMRSDDP